MTAREYLTRYRDAVRESREIEIKITQLRLRYGAPSEINYSDMPKAHNNSDLSSWDAVAEAVGYSRRTVARAHGSALQHFPMD